MGAGLSLEFLESVPKITFHGNSENQGAGKECWGWVVLHCIPGSTLPCGLSRGSTHNQGFPTFPTCASEQLLSQHISVSLP